LLLNAWRRLPEKELGFATDNIVTALRLNPFRALSPAGLRKVGKTMRSGFNNRTVATANSSSSPTGLKTPIA
jgi:hypothetical protein